MYQTLHLTPSPAKTYTLKCKTQVRGTLALRRVEGRPPEPKEEGVEAVPDDLVSEIHNLTMRLNPAPAGGGPLGIGGVNTAGGREDFAVEVSSLHCTPYTLHPTPFTLHPTPYTLHPTPYNLKPKP